MAPLPDLGAALNDRALSDLCWLIEQPDPRLAPDAVWCGERADVFQHLRDVDVLTLANDLADGVLCRECGVEVIRPVACEERVADEFPYRGCCPECGWIPLHAEHARWWHIQPPKVARWLNGAIKLASNYRVEPVVDGVLWRLGEREYGRRRHVIFFGRRLAEAAGTINDALNNLSAPGAEIIITTTDVQRLRTTPLYNRHVVPLRAIAHLKKVGFVVENLEAFLPVLAIPQTTDETSLRVMHSRRVALISGEECSLSPRVYAFLKILEDADGDEVHKRHIAEAMNFDGPFRKADIFKRHKVVFDTFIEADNGGHYWLRPEFVNLERR